MKSWRITASIEFVRSGVAGVAGRRGTCYPDNGLIVLAVVVAVMSLVTIFTALIVILEGME